MTDETRIDEAGPTLSGLVVPPDVDDEEVAADEAVETLTCAPGAVIIEAGASGDASYLVLEGQVRVRRGDRVLCRLGRGHCFGELAVLDGVPRAATVEAETAVRVLRIPAARFRRWFARHPPLEGLLGAMQQAYQRPDGGLVTLHRGTHEGAPSVSAVRRLPDGRQLLITRLTGQDVLLLSTPEADAPDTLLTYTGDRGTRTLALRDGRAVGFEARGALDASIGHLTGRIVSGRVVSPAEQARFRWTGTTGAARGGAPVLCACVGLTRAQAQAMIDEDGSAAAVRARCGAGSICGSCDAALDALASPARPKRGLLRRLLDRRR